MSLPLKDFRCGITEAIDMALEAQAAAFGADKASVAREVLQDWARRKAHEYRVYARRAHANGLQPELTGLETECGGVSVEDDGVSRRGRR